MHNLDDIEMVQLNWHCFGDDGNGDDEMDEWISRCTQIDCVRNACVPFRFHKHPVSIVAFEQRIVPATHK